MILMIVAFIYITFICWLWGYGFQCLWQHYSASKEKIANFSVTSFFGLGIIGIFSGFISLFLPLGGYTIHLILLLVAFLVLLKYRKMLNQTFRHLYTSFTTTPFFLKAFISSCVLLVLIMGAWHILHPDTLGYHAQTIQWILNYKAIPGLAHINNRLGYQGLWYVLCAVFRFDFLSTNALTFINVTVVIWFIAFIGNRIKNQLNLTAQTRILKSFLWLLLLGFCFADYNAFRLTATSAGNDFIAAMYAWGCLYLFLQNDSKSNLASYLSFFFAVFAVSLKLSLAPILLIPVYIAFKTLKDKIKVFAILLSTGILIITPILIRNSITTGYALYPSTFLSLFDFDWKLSPESVMFEKQYITAWAKHPGVEGAANVASINQMQFFEWLPYWWQHRSLAEKTILTLLTLLAIFVLLFKQKIRKTNEEWLYAIIVLLIGTLFWFMNAPDPRFGLGFIIPLIGIFSNLLIEPMIQRRLFFSKTHFTIAAFSFMAFILFYSLYRIVYYFQPIHLLAPSGIDKVAYKTVNCRDILVKKPVNAACHDTEAPCIEADCKTFILRGKRIEDGFASQP
jgi:hypothetical protein